MTDDHAACGSCHTGFNYCFWAKLIVAIPAIPIIALLASSLFSELWAKCLAGTVAVFITLLAAIKIDRMKIFSGKVVKGK